MVWVLVAVILMLVAAVGYLLLTSDLFSDQPTTDLDRDYQMLLSGLEENPDNPALLMTLAEVEYELGKTADAFAHAERAIELSEGTTGMNIRFAALLVREGRLEEARDAAQAELDVGDGTNAEPYFLIAQIDLELEEWDGAIENMEKGLALQPVAADMMIVYGRILEGAGRTDDAIVQYKRAYLFLPDDRGLVDALDRLGVSVEASGTPVAPHGDSQ